MIRLWLIPEEGLAEPTNEPHKVLAGHSEKIYFIKFHPLAEDVLASGSYDMTIRIWDLATQEERIVLEGHTDQVLTIQSGFIVNIIQQNLNYPGDMKIMILHAFYNSHFVSKME